MYYNIKNIYVLLLKYAHQYKYILDENREVCGSLCELYKLKFILTVLSVIIVQYCTVELRVFVHHFSDTHRGRT